MPTRRLRYAFIFAVSLPTLWATRADAQAGNSIKSACVQASDRAQQLRLAGKLVGALDALKACVLNECPNVVREACSQWIGEVNASVPSIVVGARDGDGKDIVDLKVSIDGTVVTEHLGGRGLPIDPGRHKMRYERADGTAVDEEILVREGEKNRALTVLFPGAPKPNVVVPGGPAASEAPLGPRTASPGNTAAGSIFAALGAGGLGLALYLDLSATNDINALKTSHCAPKCPASEVSNDQLKYDMAGVSLGVGIIALGVATYVFIAHPFGSRASEAGHAFRIVPSPNGSAFALTF